MNPLPRYATTVIGAHSVPDWYESLDRLISVGQLSMTAMADAQYRATQAAILDQELAGIDVVTGGEMHRRTHNRHAPPNAMLNHFWQRIPAFQGATRPKPITPHDPNVFHPAATCRARIHDNLDLGLVDEFRTVSALTRKPVKITMTGPHMLSKVAYDEHYNDIGAMMADLAKLLRHNFRMLAAAGCKHIQIDEPLFTMSDDAEVRSAVDAINMRDRGPARRHSCLDPHLPGQLRGRQGIRRADRTPLFRHRALQGRSGVQDRVLVLSDRARHDAPLRGADRQPPDRRRRGRRAGSEGRERRDGRGAHQEIRLAGAGTGHRHVILRFQSPAAQRWPSESCRRCRTPSASSAARS